MATVFNPSSEQNTNKSSVVVEERQPKPVNETVFQSQIEMYRQKGTVEQKKIITALDEYVKAAYPFEKDGRTLRKVSDNDGASMQHRLYQALIHVVERSPDEEFRKLWNIILAYFDNHKDIVFNGKWVYRWTYAWNWGEEKLELLQRLVNLLMLTSDPNKRSLEIRKVDIKRTVEIVLTEAGRNRIIAFYQ